MLLAYFCACMKQEQFVTAGQGLSTSLKYLLTIGCGVVVANLYYCQPLLGEFARYFQVSEGASSLINICSQLGYGLGLFFIVPLGDMIPRRKLLIWLCLLAAGSLVGMAVSPGISSLYFFSICVGAASTACQIFIPLGAHLATEESRGKVLGTLMGGLLTGILLSRTFGSIVAELWGWRSLYFLSMGMMLIMSILVWRFIPNEKPAFEGGYKKLMRSLATLFRQQPIIRESAWIGACMFGAISVFWSTMAFFLEHPPYNYSLTIIGLFGIIGTAGAIISPYVGKITDQKGPGLPMLAGSLLLIFGFLILFFGKWSISIVVLGIILIDVGMQATHVPNLARNYALLPKARTRLNTLYMTAFFIGGTLGSVLGSIAWESWQWTGVCCAGFFLAILGSVPIFRNKIRRPAVL